MAAAGYAILWTIDMLRLQQTCALEHTVPRTGWRVLAVTALILASVVTLSVVAPSAVAQGDLAADPPKELWSEFPLNPKGERLVPERQAKQEKQAKQVQAPSTPPAKAEAVPETPSPSSDGGFSSLVAAGLAGALLLLALLAVGAVRLREAAVRRRRSAPLWQGTAGIEASPVARLQQYADVDVSLTPHRRVGGPDRRAQEHGHDEKVVAGGRSPQPEWVFPTEPARFGAGEVATRGGVPSRRLHLPSLRDPATTVRHLRHTAWNDSTVPFVVGSAVAIVAAFLIIYLVG
ncbi:MAG: hypothetical protein M3364_01050 [Actinomycetota bacterium]|nr:hypothetical protein [Actinomycetota bacterium]